MIYIMFDAIVKSGTRSCRCFDMANAAGLAIDSCLLWRDIIVWTHVCGMNRRRGGDVSVAVFMIALA